MLSNNYQLLFAKLLLFAISFLVIVNCFAVMTDEEAPKKIRIFAMITGTIVIISPYYLGWGGANPIL